MASLSNLFSFKLSVTGNFVRVKIRLRKLFFYYCCGNFAKSTSRVSQRYLSKLKNKIQTRLSM